MPRIPTFTTQARPTAEVGDIRSNIQISPSQNIATALEPLTKSIMKYAAVEKFNQSKTEALELENQAVLELSTISQEASKRKNKEEANSYLLNESKRIRDQFSAKASSSQVKSIFENSYLQEEQKQIYKVDGAVYKNMLQSYANNKETKRQRILSEGLWGNNKLAEETMNNSLMQLELDDTFQDDDTKEKNIADIPVKIDYFKAKKDIERDAGSAYSQLSNNKNYSNLTVDMRTELLRESKLMAAPGVRDQADNYLAGLSSGKVIPVNETNIKNILGPDYYTEFKERQSGLIRITELSKEIFSSKRGEETSIVNKFELRNEALENDLRLREKLINNIKTKEEFIKKDPASLIISYDPIVKEKYNDFANETNQELKSRKETDYINSIYTAQQEMGIPEDMIKLLPSNESKQIVAQYNGLDARGKIALLQNLETKFGNNYGKALSQLSSDKLPITAELASYFGDENLSLQMMSFDKPEERKILDDFLKNRDIKKSDITKQVVEDLQEFREAVIFANPFNTSTANSKMDNIEEVVSYLAINNISAGMKESDAIEKATRQITDNFKIQDTYFIPKRYNNKNLSQGQIDFVIEKANIIQEKYLNLFNPKSFKSSDKSISDEELNNAMKNQMQENGVWLNTPDGNGLVYAIKFKNGSYGLLENEKGELLKFNFDDDSYNLPGTNIKINPTFRDPDIEKLIPEGF
jgi:hypothetical protein